MQAKPKANACSLREVRKLFPQPAGQALKLLVHDCDMGVCLVSDANRRKSDRVWVDCKALLELQHARPGSRGAAASHASAADKLNAELLRMHARAAAARATEAVADMAGPRPLLIELSPHRPAPRSGPRARA